MALATNAYTTLATVQDELGLSSTTSTEDARLERYINEASDMLESLTNRAFYWRSSHTEYVAAFGGRRLQVYEALPIDTLNSITLDDGVTTTTVDADDYRIEPGRAEEGFIERITGLWESTQSMTEFIEVEPSGFAYPHYAVDYDGGYITPKQDDDGVGTRDLPYDLEAAVIAYVSMRWHGQGLDTSVAKKKIGPVSVTYREGARIPEQMDNVAAHYFGYAESFA